MLFSCTKLVTSVAALQLVEQGKLDLEDLVEKYVPSIAKIQVLEGFESDGQPIVHAPKTKATILNLMTHTSGFSYDLFHDKTSQWRNHVGQGQSEYVSVGSMQCFETPFAFDPGSGYEYGISIDWLGFVVEAISGMPLNAYVEKNILKPLGMNDSGAHPKEGASPMAIHFRGEDGGLAAAPAFACAAAPERYGGGHYLYSTLDDYSTFLLTILNNGTHPISKGQILKKETVKEYLFKDYIPKICSNEGIGVIKTVNPALSLEGEFLPGVQKGHSCGIMLNLEALPKGRNAGSGQWVGLGNTYYWMDPKAGKLGLVVSSILPFMDRDVLCLFDELERAVYGHESDKESREMGGNFRVNPLPWHK